jgi:hypothetical protein
VRGTDHGHGSHGACRLFTQSRRRLILGSEPTSAVLGSGRVGASSPIHMKCRVGYLPYEALPIVVFGSNIAMYPLPMPLASYIARSAV